MKRKIKIFTIFLLLFLFVPRVFAASGGFTSGSASIYVGASTDIYINVITNGDIQAAEGTVGASDGSCIKINSVSPVVGDANGLHFAYVANGTIPSGTRIAKVNVTGLKACQARLTLNGSVTSTTQGDITASVEMGTISVSVPPSGNNNLSSLSVSVGGLNPGFSAGNTNYNVNVGSDVTSININASAEDGGARVEGTGAKSLNFGNNSFTIKVTAPSGAVKNYVINVNRADNRSGNNNLSSLSIEGVTLSPTFNANTTSYTAFLPFEYSNVNVKATAADGKATVSIAGNTGLAAEEVRNVTVTVKAENGSTKTYTISVTRAKDPNKKLATDNYLTTLTPSIGILSPVFDKEKEDYVVYLPYEVDTISFTTTLSDTKYGVLNTDAPASLVPGVSNVFKFSVTAEDESVRTYTVIVKRAVNPEATSSSNTYLKDIILTNGRLLFTNGKEVVDFNKELKKYFYKKDHDFSYEAIPEDPNATVTTVENGGSIEFVVEAPNGEFSIYTLDLYGTYNNPIKYILVFVLGCGTGIGGLYISMTLFRPEKGLIEVLKRRKKKY